MKAFCCIWLEFHLQLSADAALVKKLLADRATNPNVQDVSCLFQAWRFQQYGSDHGADMFDYLEEVAAYNKAHDDDGGKTAVQRFTSKSDSDEGKSLILAICSPIMYCTHKYIHQSSELVFTNATSCFSCPTYTRSAVGTVVRGICSFKWDCMYNNITNGLNLLKSTMPSDALLGKQVTLARLAFNWWIGFITLSIKKCVPQWQLLCLFHYLQKALRSQARSKQRWQKIIMDFSLKLVYAETLTSILSQDCKTSKCFETCERCKIMRNNGQMLIALSCVCGISTLTIIQKPVLELWKIQCLKGQAYKLVHLLYKMKYWQEYCLAKRIEKHFGEINIGD